VHIRPDRQSGVEAAAEIAPIVAAADAECCCPEPKSRGVGLRGQRWAGFISLLNFAHSYVSVNGAGGEKFKPVMRIIEG
jgi:hypothetical protein